MHIIGGASGAGKSTLLYQFIDKWRKGLPVLGYASHPEEFVYVQGDRESKMYEELEGKLGMDPVPSINMVDYMIHAEEEVDPANLNLAWLTKMIVTGLRSDPQFLVLDPVDVILGIDNFNDKMSVVRGFLKLRRWQKERTILGLLHSAKVKSEGGYSSVYDTISGSQSIQAYSSTRMVLEEKCKAHDYNSVLHIKGQLFPEHTVVLDRDYNGAFTVLEVHNDWKARDKIMAVLLGGEMDRGDLLARCDVPERTLTRHLAALVAKGQIVKTERGVYRAVSKRLELVRDNS